MLAATELESDMVFQFEFEVLGVAFEMAVVFKSAPKFVTAG